MSKILIGKVVSKGKMAGTITVAVTSRRPHPLYKKIVKKTSRFLVDNQETEIKVGDTVKILEVKPISKRKHFKLFRERK